MKITLSLTIGDNSPDFSAFVKNICFGADRFTFAIATADRLVRLIENSLTKERSMRCWCIIECEIYSKKVSINGNVYETNLDTVEILGFINDFQDKMKNILSLEKYNNISMEINKIEIKK